MIKRAILIGLLFASSVFASTGETAQTEDKGAIVAKVNGLSITEQQVQNQLNTLLPRQYYHASVSGDRLVELRKEALDRLIDWALIYSQAKKEGYEVSKEEMVKLLQEVKAPFSDEKSFQAALKRAALTEATLKDELEYENIIKKYTADHIEVTLTDEELKAYYEKNKFKFKEPEKIRVKLIYVKNDPTDPDGRDKARERANEAHKKIADGENTFGEVAEVYSNDMYRVKGGEMGTIHRGRLAEPVENVAFALEEGKLSDVIEMDIGYFIVMVDEKYEPNQLTFDEVKKSLARELKEKEEKNRRDSLMERLRSEANIVINNQ